MDVGFRKKVVKRAQVVASRRQEQRAASFRAAERELELVTGQLQIKERGPHVSGIEAMLEVMADGADVVGVSGKRATGMWKPEELNRELYLQQEFHAIWGEKIGIFCASDRPGEPSVLHATGGSLTVFFEKVNLVFGTVY